MTSYTSFHYVTRGSDWSYGGRVLRRGNDHCPKTPMVIATELGSREQAAGDEPRGEVMGLGNSQIMQHIFFKWQLIYRPAWFLPLHLSVPGKWLVMHEVMRRWEHDTKDRFACDSEELLRALQRDPGFRHEASNHYRWGCLCCSDGNT